MNATALRAAMLIAAAATPMLASGSSHREAPFITGVPKVDGTDLYMFRSYESGREGYVTLLANYLPLQAAYGGPNYFALDEKALYEIHIDNNGDSREDLTFQFRFEDKYKEHNPERYAADVAKVLAAGKTPAGTHRPIMVAEILQVLALQPGEVAVDCTLGYGGHAREILPRLSPGGRLIGLDVDPLELPRTTARLRAAGWSEAVFTAVRSNFAGLPKVLAGLGLPGADALLLVTEWNEFRHPDFERMRSLMKEPVIFDGRNLYEPSRIRQKGFTYYAVGRP